MSETPTPPSLTAQAVHGLKWSYASSFLIVFLQVGVTAVLARLLTPSEFGVVAMAALFIKFGQYFAQLGAGQAVVQRQDLSDTHIRTAFTSAFLLGLGFTLVFVALAPVTALLFPEGEGVVGIARAMSLSFVIGGLTATPQALLRRRFAFRAIAMTEMGSYLLGYAGVALVLAVAGFGAWSLVIATLLQAGIGAAIYVLVCRRRIGFALDRTSLRDIYSFGGRVSLIGFGEFIASNLDTFWTGRYLGSAAIGYYTRATNIAIAPLYFATMSLWRVLLPAFSRLQTDLERLRSAYLQSITLVAVLVMPTSWGAAAASEEIVLTLLGPTWTPAIPILRVLALAVPFILLTDFAAVVCEATAALNSKIAITLGKIVAMAVFLALFARFGIVGVAVAYALSTMVGHVAYAAVTKRRLKMTGAQLASTYTVGVESGVVVGLLVFGVHLVLGSLGTPAWTTLVVQVAIGLGVLVLTFAKARNGSLWQSVRCRLTEAGYAPDGPGVAAWLIRRMDSIT